MNDTLTPTLTCSLITLDLLLDDDVPSIEQLLPDSMSDDCKRQLITKNYDPFSIFEDRNRFFVGLLDMGQEYTSHYARSVVESLPRVPSFHLATVLESLLFIKYILEGNSSKLGAFSVLEDDRLETSNLVCDSQGYMTLVPKSELFPKSCKVLVAAVKD